MKDPVKFSGELIGWHDPDENRRWVRENKSRKLTDKRTTVAEAIRKYVPDGSLVAIGGFGHIRVPMAHPYELIRQRKRDLTVICNPGCHDIDILIGGGCVSRVDVAYAFGHELRGLSPCGRRAVESGQVKVTSEISNAGYQWLLAAAMGVPFMPVRSLLGTNTIEHSSAKVIETRGAASRSAWFRPAIPTWRYSTFRAATGLGTPRSTASWPTTSSWRGPPGGW